MSERIGDSVVIYIHFDGIGGRGETTWGAFCAANPDEDLIAIEDDLIARCRSYGGGGAGPGFTILTEDWEPSDHEIYNGPGIEGGITYPIGGFR